MQPTDHHITVTDHRGNTIRGKVVYLQPRAERWRKDVAEVHIIASDWLDPYRYPATYTWPGGWVTGHFMAHRYRMVEGDYLYEGTFEAESKSPGG